MVFLLCVMTFKGTQNIIYQRSPAILHSHTNVLYLFLTASCEEKQVAPLTPRNKPLGGRSASRLAVSSCLSPAASETRRLICGALFGSPRRYRMLSTTTLLMWEFPPDLFKPAASAVESRPRVHSHSHSLVLFCFSHNWVEAVCLWYPKTCGKGSFFLTYSCFCFLFLNVYFVDLWLSLPAGLIHPYIPEWQKRLQPNSSLSPASSKTESLAYESAPFQVRFQQISYHAAKLLMLYFRPLGMYMESCLSASSFGVTWRERWCVWHFAAARFQEHLIYAGAYMRKISSLDTASVAVITAVNLHLFLKYFLSFLLNQSSLLLFIIYSHFSFCKPEKNKLFSIFATLIAKKAAGKVALSVSNDDLLYKSSVGSGGHALRAGPAQSLSPLVSPSEGELAAPLSPSTAATLDSMGPPSSSSTSAAHPPLKDNPGLAEFVPMLTQGWAEIFIRRPSGG